LLFFEGNEWQRINFLPVKKFIISGKEAKKNRLKIYTAKFQKIYKNLLISVE